MGIFLEGEDSRGDYGLGRLVEFRFKDPPGTTSSSITTHTPSGQRNCASLASQSQKSVTLLPCPGGRTTKSTKDMWWHWTKILKPARQTRPKFELGGRGAKIGTIKEVNKACVTCTSCRPKHVTIMFFFYKYCNYMNFLCNRHCT